MVKSRLLKYDIIRVVAISMVVMAHVSAYLVIDFPDTGNMTFIVGNIFNGMSHAATPLFLMLSGALLLDEKKSFSVKKFYNKNLCSIILLLVFWLFFYAVFYAVILPVIQGKATELHRIKYYLIFEGRYKHLWYLYMLIGAYIAVPILRLWVKEQNKKYVIGAIFLSLVVQFFVQSASVFTRNRGFSAWDVVGKFHVEYATGYISYLLIGWYLGNIQIHKRMRSALIFLGLIAMFSIIVIVQFNIDNIPEIRSYVAEMDTLPTAVWGIGVFLFLQKLAGNRNTNKVIVMKLSDAAFGVYVIHILILELFANKILPYSAFNDNNPLLYIIILFLVVYGCSLFFVLLISKVKGIRFLFHY